MNYAVIFAGGVGKRMGTEIPKQFLSVNEKPIIVYTIEHFSKCDRIDGIVVVCLSDYINVCNELVVKYRLDKVLSVIEGGSTSQESTFNGLEYLKNNIDINDNDIVLIHDGVRPLIDEKLIVDNIDCVIKNGNCITAAKAIETIVKIDNNNSVSNIIDRSSCRYARAPQSFYLNDIYKLHSQAISDKKQNLAIDSATLMNMYGHKLYTVECSQENIKITTLNDYYMFKGMVESGCINE